MVSKPLIFSQPRGRGSSAAATAVKMRRIVAVQPLDCFIAGFSISTAYPLAIQKYADFKDA